MIGSLNFFEQSNLSIFLVIQYKLFAQRKTPWVLIKIVSRDEQLVLIKNHSLYHYIHNRWIPNGFRQKGLTNR